MTEPDANKTTGSRSGGAAQPGTSPGDRRQRSAVVRLLFLAAVLGLLATLAAVVFYSLVHQLETLLWSTLPGAVGWGEPPWWYVMIVPVLGGLLVALALRLPGHGGHHPLQGLGTDPVTPLALVSVLLASLATLSFGLVLGPEAPLLAIGLTCGLVLARAVKAGADETKVISLAGAFSVLSMLLGALPASLMLFEMVAARGIVPSAKLGRILLPGLVAAGSGTLLFTGIAPWSGINRVSLSLPPLPSYPTVRLADLFWCLFVAVVCGLAVVLSWRLARVVADVARRHLLATLVGVGFLVGLLAVVFRALTDQPIDLVLFSGTNALPQLVALSSVGVVALLVVEKALAYGLSLGAGFRGGPIFPGTFLGVGIGILASFVLPGLELTPAVITGLAASAAAVMRAPFFGALLAVLLGGAAAAQTIPLAIFGAVIGWVVALIFSVEQPSETEGA